MRNVMILTLNTLKVTFRKKGNIIVFLFLPIIGILFSMLIYGSGGNGNVSVGILDEDKSALSQDLIKSIEKQGKFSVSTVDKNEINSKITTGKADCVLKIPQGFEEGIFKKTPMEVELLSIKGEAVSVWLKNYLDIYVSNLLALSEASQGNKESFNKMYEGIKLEKSKLKVSKLEDTYTGKGMTSQSLGFLILFMMLGAGFTSELILKEKRSRTYYRINSAPVKAWTYIAGNVLTSLIIIFIQIAIVLFVMIQGFKINTFVPVYQILIILMSFGLVAIGFGLLLVAFSKDTLQAGTMQTLIVTPTCMLGGCFWPLDMMPKTVQKVADFVPQKWALEAIGKLQTGKSFSEILIYIAVILAFAAAFFLIAIYRFSRNESVANFR